MGDIWNVIAEKYSYDPITGIVTGPRGQVKGQQQPNGYVTHRFRWNGCYKQIGLHRVGWAIAKKETPPKQIDHINGCRKDNSLQNLRAATPSQNQQNKTGWSATGFKGVYFKKKQISKPYEAVCNGKYIGIFATAQEAAMAYDAAAEKAFGEYARLNFPARKGK